MLPDARDPGGSSGDERGAACGSHCILHDLQRSTCLMSAGVYRRALTYVNVEFEAQQRKRCRGRAANGCQMTPSLRGLIALRCQASYAISADPPGRPMCVHGALAPISQTLFSASSHGDIRRPSQRTHANGPKARMLRAEHHTAVGILVLSPHVEPSFALRLVSDGAGGVGYLLKEGSRIATDSPTPFGETITVGCRRCSLTSAGRVEGRSARGSG